MHTCAHIRRAHRQARRAHRAHNYVSPCRCVCVHYVQRHVEAACIRNIYISTATHGTIAYANLFAPADTRCHASQMQISMNLTSRFSPRNRIFEWPRCLPNFLARPVPEPRRNPGELLDGEGTGRRGRLVGAISSRRPRTQVPVGM